MKTIILMFCLALASCTSAPKTVDPFDAAITQSLNVMMGGIVAPNAGGMQ